MSLYRLALIFFFFAGENMCYLYYVDWFIFEPRAILRLVYTIFSSPYNIIFINMYVKYQ